MVAGMEGVGVETFERAGGLAELRMTIVVKWGWSILFEKF